MMIPISMHVEPGQENRIRKAIKNQKGCRIKVRKYDQSGPHHLFVTTNMLKKYAKAKKGELVPLNFKHEHLMNNMKKGGFLPLIAAALAPVIGGVLGGVLEKEISGKGIQNKGKQNGNGLYLNPWPHNGHGLYLNPYQ